MRFSTQMIAIATLAVCTFLSNRASSQEGGELKGSGGRSSGSFIGRGGVGGGNQNLMLNLEFALEEKVSPGMTYAVLQRATGTQFAYYCVVLHRYSGELHGEFPYDCRVEDYRGQIEQSLKVGTLGCKIAYSVVVDRKSTSKDKETLSIQGTDVDLSQGRLFIVDMTGDTVVIKQAASPSAIASKLSAKKATEIADRILRDVSKSLNDGELETRVVNTN